MPTEPKTPYMTNQGHQAPSSSEVPLVAVGVITGAHGIKGQVKLRSFTNNPQDIENYTPLLNDSGTRRFELQIDGETRQGLIATIKGIKDRNTAEVLKGTQLFTEKSKLPPAEEEEFYYDELIGQEVRDNAGAVLGKVVALYDFGAGDIIEIKMAAGSKEMYPFTRQNFPEIHSKEGYILAELPEIIDAKGKA